MLLVIIILTICLLGKSYMYQPLTCCNILSTKTKQTIPTPTHSSHAASSSLNSILLVYPRKTDKTPTKPTHTKGKQVETTPWPSVVERQPRRTERRSPEAGRPLLDTMERQETTRIRVVVLDGKRELVLRTLQIQASLIFPQSTQGGASFRMQLPVLRASIATHTPTE